MARPCEESGKPKLLILSGWLCCTRPRRPVTQQLPATSGHLSQDCRARDWDHCARLLCRPPRHAATASFHIVTRKTACWQVGHIYKIFISINSHNGSVLMCYVPNLNIILSKACTWVSDKAMQNWVLCYFLVQASSGGGSSNTYPVSKEGEPV